MGGLGGSPSRRAPVVLPSPRISIAAHSFGGKAIQVGWGARGEGRTESGHAPLVSTGRDGRGHGRERTAISHPARRVAAGGPVERFGSPLPRWIRTLFFVPGGRQDARLGRPVVFRPVRPKCPAGDPRSVRVQPT